MSFSSTNYIETNGPDHCITGIIVVKTHFGKNLDKRFRKQPVGNQSDLRQLFAVDIDGYFATLVLCDATACHLPLFFTKTSIQTYSPLLSLPFHVLLSKKTGSRIAADRFRATA